MAPAGGWEHLMLRGSSNRWQYQHNERPPFKAVHMPFGGVRPPRISASWLQMPSHHTRHVGCPVWVLLCRR